VVRQTIETVRRFVTRGRRRLCLRLRSDGHSTGVASYDGPAKVIWKHKGSVKSARVRCVAESYGPMSWQGKLVKFPAKLCALWETDDLLTLRLPGDEVAAIRPTRISLGLQRPTVLGFVGVGSAPF
jgi:hypothetical protein